MSINYKMQNILKTLNKAYNGPICNVKDWDTKVVPQAVKAKLKKYGIEKCYDPENPINTNDDLADTFYKAGRELALEIGILCEETERIIKIDEKELEDALNHYPKEIVYGKGRDRVVMKPRKPEDPYVPIIFAPLALMMSEKNVTRALAGFAKYPKLVDVLNGLTIDKPLGIEVRSGTPYETWLGHYEQELKREALWIAGREEMGTCGVGNSTTEYGHLAGAPATPGVGRTTMSLLPAELKVCFGNFHRIIQAINYGDYLHVGGPSYIGGYAGSPEGAILANIANEHLIVTALSADNTCCNIFDIKYFSNVSRRAVWANSVTIQALSRNTNIMTDRIVNEISGPCTEQFFYEAAVGLMNHCVSGASKCLAPRSAGGRYTDYITPVEGWWCGQVFKSCAGMSRSDANEIAKVLLPKYEDNLLNPPQGKSINECFNLDTLEPTEEYRELYDRMKQELIELGIPLDKVFEL